MLPHSFIIPALVIQLYIIYRDKHLPKKFQVYNMTPQPRKMTALDPCVFWKAWKQTPRPRNEKHLLRSVQTNPAEDPAPPSVQFMHEIASQTIV